MSRIRLATLGFCSLFAVHALGAQRVLGPWDDASTLRAGALRLSLGVAWDRANERYDADGKLHGLGAAASAASWNGAYDARLGAASPLVSTLSGLSSFDASLGVLAIGRRDASTDVPVAIEVGLLSRLTIGASARVVNHGIEPGVTINPGRIEGTMGFNPAWSNTAAAGRNGTLVTQFDSATAQMTRRIAQCQAAPATAGCTSINTNVAGAQALVANARTFADALNQLYGGRPASVGLPFVPVGGTAAQKAIDQRILGFRDQFTALGNGAIAGDGPAPAARFAQDDITRLLTDSATGYLLRPLRHVSAYGLAELRVSAKLRLFDGTGDDTTTLRGLHVRQSVGASLHLGGADEPKGDEVFAPTAGSIGTGASARSYTDIFYGRRFAASVVLGAEMSQDESFDMRLAAADAPAVGGVPFPMQLASRAVRITRSPGTRIDATLTPRFAVTRAFWIGASYRYAQQGADAWSISSKPAGGTATAQDATHWAAGTDWTEQRLSLGATYSTLAAARAGKTRRAFDVSYQYEQVLLGAGWRVPKLTRDVVTVRWYQSLWGRQGR